jgi:hypothetical protein
MEEAKYFKTYCRFSSKKARKKYFENLIAYDVVKYKHETIKCMKEKLQIRWSYFKLLKNTIYFFLFLSLFNYFIMNNILLFIIFFGLSIISGLSAYISYRLYIKRYNCVYWTIDQLSNWEFLMGIQEEQLLIFEERKNK